ncbi:MAG TPA: GGDEF domain-containing protein [Longimicrobiales bacterium]|nr:GGDEF domain-containing protein [Longimicrobiales bacterium]
MRDRIRAVLRPPLRLVFPEGVLVLGLVLLPLVPEIFTHVEPLALVLLAGAALTAVAVGGRFGRGRPAHAMAVLLAAGGIAMLPAQDPARSLAALLVPINLALIGLLPDRGIWTRGGLLRSFAILAQVGAVAAFLAYGPGTDPLATLHVPGIGTVDPYPLAGGAALLALGTLAMAAASIPARGLFWATVAAMLVETGYPGGAAYLLAIGGLVLVVATLENAHALAYRDALTGLPSRRALFELLERTSREFAVAMVDVDHFKKFNDRHGHDVGDQVLRMVATHLRETGGGAQAFRYGGEEFALVFRGGSVKDARPHLDALRESIAAAEFGVRSADRPKKKPRKVIPARNVKKLSVTVSIGVAERTDGSRPATEVLEAADAALYRAKRAGRNRVSATGR